MMKAQLVPVTPLQQNCSVVWCDETMEGVLVDPGGDVDQILEVVKEHGITLVKLLLTHGHLDHAGGAADIKEKLGLPIIGPHRDDKFWLDQIEDHAAQYGLSGLRNCTPDQWLDEGDTVTFGNVTLSVYHCPGHTPGHIVFYERDKDVAFVGDVIFKGSIGRTDFPRGNHSDLIASITTKLWPLGNTVTFVPGHGPLSTFGIERATNPFVSDKVLAET